MTPVKQKRNSSKTAVVSFRISNETYERLTSNAAKAGISTKLWLEKAILENQTKIVERAKPNRDLSDLVVQVNRAGNNINQIAHNLNTAALTSKLTKAECEDALKRLDHLRALLNELISHASEN
ncbi:mobilization protein MobC [Advenella incenata]|uniref:Mobilization protein MobC n=1 Tax=Advenella incenata TaxID=267800 RepID=A0A4Q7V5T7_9BURK|nr:plasmid mobilization relaxosome protein MobC [Advenella incenata]RZT91184.1 mobilization protein MobC [Advenella incenata]